VAFVHTTGDGMAIKDTEYFVSVYYQAYQPFLVYETKTRSKEVFQKELVMVSDQYQRMGYRIVTAEVVRHECLENVLQEVYNKRGLM